MTTGPGLPGWYGKIPGAGDFVSRRLAAEDVHWWAAWLQCGLQYHDERYASWRHSYARAPAWNFVISGGPGAGPQLGCIVPSRDRVGRSYPLCLLLPGQRRERSDPIALRLACQWLTGIGHCALEGIRRASTPEDFDLALGALMTLRPEAAQAPGGPDLTPYVDASGPLSFWWTNAASGGPPRHHVHHGAPNNLLFGQLFGGDL